MFKHLKIRTKLLLELGLIIVLTGGLGAYIAEKLIILQRVSHEIKEAIYRGELSDIIWGIAKRNIAHGWEEWECVQ